MYKINYLCCMHVCQVTQSCPTLCEPMDHGPPASSVHGILQARTLEWVAISFSNAWKWSHSVMSTLCDLMDCSPPGFSVHGIFQARVLEWVAIAFSDLCCSEAQLSFYLKRRSRSNNVVFLKVYFYNSTFILCSWTVCLWLTHVSLCPLWCQNLNK